MNPLSLELRDMPASLPLFPLPNALLLPGSQLPLNIFEPRYLAMIEDALQTPHRMIGMVQPLNEEGTLFDVGCAGRITYFQESGDGRYMIALSGICRFHLQAEQLTDRGYRQASIDWSRFAGDLKQADDSIDDRKKLLSVMKRYFEVMGYEADWDQIEQSGNEQILNTLAAVCPFDVAEKQALLEAQGLSKRADILIAIMEMALHNEDGGNDARH
ncbi:MAG: LON peptidase substrate-binding domain-containing protein [Alphaproteobacteria bacterium]|jgi:Lon protease-like protein